MIIDLYKTLIICDKYNCKINDSVNITVRCIGYDKQPVISEDLTVYYDNNKSIHTGTTNSNGEFSFEYTFSDYGMHTLTVNDIMVQVNVEREIHPVGSIYLSLNDTDPSVLFGGEWARLNDRFLLGASTTYKANSTGGNKNAVVVSHNHTQNSHNHSTNNSSYKNFLISTGNIAVNGTKRGFTSEKSGGHHFVYTDSNVDIGEITVTQSQAPYIQYKGEDGTNKNMPPYLAVYMWKRTQ